MASLRLVVFFQIIFYSTAANWSYLNQEEWPQTCHGALQSPIALSPANSSYKYFTPFKFKSDASGSNNIEVVNNGHSVKIRFTNTTNSLSGGGLEGEYILDSFHFHWDAEHTVKELRYPLEGHFVYFAKKYKTFENARKFKNGIAVLGVLYDSLLLIDCPYFTFTSVVPKIVNKVDQPVSIKLGTKLRNLLPVSLTKFYRYEGSLTTPNCDEVVIWTVFSTSKLLSRNQWKALTSVQDGSGQLVTSNHRELQSSNNRPIYRSALLM